MKKKGLFNNIVLSTFYQVLTMVLPLITAPYAARVLGVEGIGIYSYTNSYSMYFCIFAALGTVAYGTREIAQHRDNRAERSQLFWEIVCLSFVTSTVCLLGWGVWTYLNIQYRIYYLILTFTLLGTMLDISWLYAGLEEFKYTVLQNSIFKILGTISIFVFVRQQEDLWIYILILSATVFLANGSMWIYLPKFVDPVPLKGIRIKHHFRETLIYFVPMIAVSIYTVLDKTLIGLITQEASENGYYEQATKIVNMAKTLSFAGVNMVLQSRISYLFVDKRHDEIKQHIALSMDYILFMGFGLCFGMIGVASRFIPWFFGPGYEHSIILLQMLAPVTIIIGISNCLGFQYYTPAGLRAKSAKYIIAGSLVNLGMNLLLIPRFKSVGAVIATLIAETVITMLYMVNNSGYYTFRKLGAQMWKKLIAGILMCGVILMIAPMISSAFLAVVVQVIAGGTVYIVVLLILKDSFVREFALPFCKNMISRRKKKDGNNDEH